MMSYYKCFQAEGFAPGRYEYWYSLVFFLVVVVAVATRIYAIDTPSLWSDELWGLWVCSFNSLFALINQMIWHDSHPPGYQTFLYFWLHQFGTSDFSVRFPSFLAGVASVFSLYAFSSRYFSKFVSLVSAALLAVSYNAIYYSQEARAYIFILLFFIWNMHIFFLLFIDKKVNDVNLNIFIICGLLLAYFHYVGVVILSAELLILLVFPYFRRQIEVTKKVYSFIFLLYMPWFFVFLKHLFMPNDAWVMPVPDFNIVVRTLRFIWGNDDGSFIFGLVAVFFLFGYSFRQWRSGALFSVEKKLLLLFLIVFLPWLLFFIKSHIGLSAYTIRHFIYVIPVAILINAWFLEKIILWMAPIAIAWKIELLIIIPIMAFYMANNIHGVSGFSAPMYGEHAKQEYRQAVRTILLDDAFVAKNKNNIFVSSIFFNHYLKRFGVIKNTALFVRELSPERVFEYERYLLQSKSTEFYYLELLKQKSPLVKYSPLMQVFRSRYHTICVTEFSQIRVTKFSTQLQANPDEVVRVCPQEL